MAAAAVAPLPIQWKITQPASGDEVAETHCPVCLDPTTNSPILAHTLSATDTTLVHRIHRTCLQQIRAREEIPNYMCLQCQRPYNPNEVPHTWTELIGSSLGEVPIRHLSANFFLYLVLGLMSAPLSIPISIFNKGFYPPTLKSMVVGNIKGVFCSALVLSLVGDTALFVGRRTIEKITRPSSFQRIASLFLALPLTYPLFRLTTKAVQWYLIPTSPPKIRVLIDRFLRDHRTGLSQFSPQLRATVLEICEATTAFAAGRSATLKLALCWKAVYTLLYLDSRLDGFHLWHQG